MVTMKRVLLLLTFSGMALEGADLSSVRTVYLLPMGSALDQYLANRLTNEHVFQVVTDPKLANAVFTDRIGNAFEEKLADLTAPPAKAQTATDSKAAPAQSPSNQAAANQPAAAQVAVGQPGPQRTLPFGEPVNKLSNPAANSTFGRGKGTIFLVDPKSKQVIWSVFEPPKGFTSSELDRSASDIVGRLKRDLKNPAGSKP
jgi:hypothetical protein